MATGGQPDADRPASADPAEAAPFRAVRAAVLDRIAQAARRSGRDPAAVTLVAVSKTVPVERVRAAVAAGLTILGENRVQEGELKRGLVHGATWHLIGPLQSNKARRAIETFDVIQSVDSLELARRLDRLVREVRGPEARLPVLLQVNVDVDAAKAGYDPDRLAAELPELASLGGLELGGLMTIGRLVAEPAAARPTFVALRRLSERLRGGVAGPRTGTVDGHDRRFRGGGRRGRDDRPGRPGALRRTAVTAPEVRFAVRLTPRAGRDRVDGVGEDGMLRVRVAAPPADGAANEALVRLLADVLGVAPSEIRIVAGRTTRRKIVAVGGLADGALLARWPGLGRA